MPPDSAPRTTLRIARGRPAFTTARRTAEPGVTTVHVRPHRELPRDSHLRRPPSPARGGAGRDGDARLDGPGAGRELLRADRKCVGQGTCGSERLSPGGYGIIKKKK